MFDLEMKAREKIAAWLNVAANAITLWPTHPLQVSRWPDGLLIEWAEYAAEENVSFDQGIVTLVDTACRRRAANSKLMDEMLEDLITEETNRDEQE